MNTRILPAAITALLTAQVAVASQAPAVYVPSRHPAPQPVAYMPAEPVAVVTTQDQARSALAGTYVGIGAFFGWQHHNDHQYTNNRSGNVGRTHLALLLGSGKVLSTGYYFGAEVDGNIGKASRTYALDTGSANFSSQNDLGLHVRFGTNATDNVRVHVLGGIRHIHAKLDYAPNTAASAAGVKSFSRDERATVPSIGVGTEFKFLNVSTRIDLFRTGSASFSAAGQEFRYHRSGVRVVALYTF